MTQTKAQALGALGERIAERWLVRDGWQVVDRRWRSGRRDLDLVAIRGNVVAFVEVKTRRSTWSGGPVEAVNWRKQRELTRSAQAWIDQRGTLVAPAPAVFRFDVVGVVASRERVGVCHVTAAFPAFQAAQ
ncbi:MAG: YraN family protein [Gemmatimonadaceae bacterium]|nr:YraN family protein [Gemmatimonadaceae bacterium]